MKRMYFCLLMTIVLVLTAQATDLKDGQKKLVIGCHQSKAGLFSMFFCALNNIAWCEKNNVVPVVYWDDKCVYYSDKGHNGGKNVWEYYFEPVSWESYRPNDEIRKAFRDPDNQSINVLQHPVYDKAIRDEAKVEHRKNVNKLIQKYVKIKRPIMDKVELFYQKNMVGKKNIGIHIRGTDKVKEVGAARLEDIVTVANNIAKAIPDAQFFVATDELQLLTRITPLLNGKVISYDVTRSDSKKPLHLSNKNNPALGEEVLIEVQLLSRCDMFVHTYSNVASAVLFFNPDLKNFVIAPAPKAK